ncbi:MAG: histidine phosphatase family protein [Candidatus Berkelbacteria bacterium]|nr:histidine phosphatase family protein [Candidatus Berkelbacteria bacterium]
MKIFLIRHGESTSDIENRYGGDYDDALTEKGEDQAKKLAKELEDEGIEVVYSSPRIRALSTAQKLFSQSKDKIVIMPNFRERNYYGSLTGMKKDEAVDRFPDLVELLEDRNNTLPNGESYTEFSKRIKAAWNQMTTAPYKIVALVAHAGSIRCIYREILHKGELENIGDCEFISLSNDSGDWKVLPPR